MRQSAQEMKTSVHRGKASGWAAFALKQQKNQSLEPKIEHDPFPPISTSSTGSLHTSGSHIKTNGFSNRSFSSTLLSPVNFPTLADGRISEKQLQTSFSYGTQDKKSFADNNDNTSLKKLKKVHSWADDDLIRDILDALDNDIDKASTLLEGMVSSGLSEEGETRKEDSIQSKKYGCDKTTSTKFITRGLSSPSLPLEPEWEEDEDIYLRFRKHAIKAMRSASQHSRAARNAFLRGDHVSAKQLSLRAREEWMASERLNSQAAKEILRTRNEENDAWKLDLHGLHATEATHILREHLKKIESMLSFNRSVSPGKDDRFSQRKDTIVRSPSVEFLRNRDTENKKQSHTSRQRSSSLQVITGVGNHSRGQAALPAAVRSFLNENRYHFDETRPGVLTVRPKFRHS